MRSEIVIKVACDGAVRFVHDDDLEAALGGTCRKQRASHVEPVQPVLRWLFHCIRSRVADDSWLAGWTRRWPCVWQARIFDGPVLGPFVDRKAAISAEVDWLESHVLN